VQLSASPIIHVTCRSHHRVIVGLLITGRTLSLAVLIGVILLAGIAVNNGIVMIDYINQLIKRGVGQAGRPSCRERRPVCGPSC